MASLIHEADYAKQVNQVATVWTQQIRFVRRKELAMTAFAVELLPMSEVRSITYETRHALGAAFLGLACVAILALVLWSPIPAGTKVPIGALFLVAGAGLVWMRGTKRHVIEFRLKDRTAIWQSRAGEFKDKKVVVDRVMAFAREAGLARRSH